tara:strand:+ start:889 stop:1128 length:240 start_codon:yes stop_codon:yes gene_type:complete
MTSNIPKKEEETSSLNQNKELIEDSIEKASATTTDIPSFGWSQYAERVNGRFAMIGFLSIALIEILSHSNFLNWAGLIN